ncbi:histidinol-phosphate transaminase [Gordonia sp. DT30]|uniref:histidinol-phosphate transaminase n=1 Tax=Gordonia sp. DT30 TaxID=3416546 RepID=UPI003CED00D1
MSFRIRPDLDDLPVYVPGKTFPDAIKLASNEVTHPPLPSVLKAITAAAAGVNRYPDNGMVELTDTLAKELGVGREEIQVGCGSVILCQNLILVTCRPGDEVVFGWRSFETYPLATRLVGATAVQVPLTGDDVYDLAAMADAVTDRTRLIFVCNPNNPTGTVVTAADLREFLNAVPDDVVVALDEAYIEYARFDDEHAYDALELRREFPNLVTLRTFSKAYGLAGLRVGYAIADPEIITALGKAHVPFSVNSVAQAAALACLAARDELLARTDAVVAERRRVTEHLRAAGYRVPDSQANFVWLDLAERSLEFAQAGVDAGVVVRPFADDGVRVTVTHADENDRFLAFAREWQQAREPHTN